MLHITGTESPMIRALTVLLTAKLGKRFPVFPLNICAFLPDSVHLKIDINRYLIQHHEIKPSTLSNMIKKFQLNHVSHVSSTENI